MQHNTLYSLSVQWLFMEAVTNAKSNNQPQNAQHDEFTEVATAPKTHF